MPSGILIINKPQDWTSMDVCAKLRGVFHEKRVGHAGTLDPMATGVLPVFVGRATRAVQFAETGEKEYVAALRLGLATNTQDVWGEAVEERPVPADAADRLQATLPRFTGEIEQLPPMYSAIKVNGKKLYELARKGLEVARKPRSVTIHSLELLDAAWQYRDVSTHALLAQGSVPSSEEEKTFFLRVRCSKGTYIRTLCHDIGQTLGCGGCMAALTRTEACGFPLGEALALEEVINASDPPSLLRPVDQLFRGHSALTVNAQGTERLRHGGTLSFPNVKPGLYRVYSPSGEFLALGEVGKGRLTTIKNFFEV